MRPLPRFLALTLVIAGSILVYAKAFAGDASPAPSVNLTTFVPLISAALGALAGAVRQWTPTDGFWHTKWGHLVISLAGFLIGGLMAYFQPGGPLTKAGLLNALVTALTAWAMSFKTSGKPPSNAVAAPSAPGGAA